MTGRAGQRPAPRRRLRRQSLERGAKVWTKPRKSSNFCGSALAPKFGILAPKFGAVAPKFETPAGMGSFRFSVTSVISVARSDSGATEGTENTEMWRQSLENPPE